MEEEDIDLRRLLNEVIGTWNNDKQMTGKVFVLNFISPLLKMKTRLHSIRMRTARALTVSPSMLCDGGMPPPGVLLPRGASLLGGLLARGGLLTPGGSPFWGVLPAGRSPCHSGVSLLGGSPC